MGDNLPENKPTRKRAVFVIISIGVIPMVINIVLGFDLTLSFYLGVALSVLVGTGVKHIRDGDFFATVKKKTNMGIGLWSLVYLALFGGLVLTYFHGRPSLFYDSIGTRRGISLYGYLAALYFGGVMVTPIAYFNRERTLVDWRILTTGGALLALGTFSIMYMMG